MERALDFITGDWKMGYDTGLLNSWLVSGLALIYRQGFEIILGM